MSEQGSDRPPERPDGSERPDGPEKPEKPEKPDAKDEPEAPKGSEKPDKSEPPEYTIYGRSGRSGQKRTAPAKRKGPKAGDRPYTVSRSRPSLRDRLTKPSLQSIRKGTGGGIRGFFGRLTGGKRPWLRWVLIGIAAWFLLSFITFAISAQIQKGKLPDSAKDALAGGPAGLARPNSPLPRGGRPGTNQPHPS